jgi:hypothetical protein
MIVDLLDPPQPQMSGERLATRREHLLSEVARTSDRRNSVAAPTTTRRPKLARGRRSKLARGRRYAVLALALLFVLVPLTALASSQGWWFLGHNAPPPITPVSVIEKGNWNGVRWTLTAYRTGSDGICWALTPEVAGQRSGRGAGMACDTINGVSRTARSVPFTPHDISYMQSFNSQALGSYVTGPVVHTAAQVEIVLRDGTRLRAATVPAPRTLDSQIRFYVVQLPAPHPGAAVLTQGVRTLTGLDAHGKVVARMEVPLPPSSQPENRISNAGRPIALSSAMKQRLRAAHRSSQVWLLASRGGRNFYRFGNCFGIGPWGDPTKFPAAKGPAAFGEMLCAKHFPSYRRPVLDGSIFERRRGEKTATLTRLQGFASDAVREVTLIGAHGRILRRVPVAGNVYGLDAVPPGVLIIAVGDRRGRPIARCGPNAHLDGGGSYLAGGC